MHCNQNCRSKKKDCIFFPFRFRKKRIFFMYFFTPEGHQPATETSNPTSLPGAKNTTSLASWVSWTNKHPRENWHYESKLMLVSWKDGEGWENHQRNGEDEKLHSGKSTGNSKSWRWMEDDFPFFIGWIFRFAGDNFPGGSNIWLW